MNPFVASQAQPRRGKIFGLTLLPASLLAGWLWDTVSPATPFFFGAGLAFVAMLGLMALVRE